MNIGDLITELSREFSLPKTLVKSVVSSIISKIMRKVNDGEKVKLTGFGLFSKSARKSRVGRNPKTGVTANISARNIVKFKAGQKFKDAINKEQSLKPKKKRAAKSSRRVRSQALST